MSPKEEIVKALQELKSHVGVRKDNAAVSADPGDAAKPGILQEIEGVLEKLIALLTGGK